MKKYRAYNVKAFWQGLLLMVAVILGMKISNGAAYGIAFVMTLFAAMTGKYEKLFFWLLLSVAALSCNQYFAPKGMVFVVLQRVGMVLLGVIMVAKVFGRRNNKVIVPFFMMIGYAFYMIIPSSFGWSPLVSYLKLILFVLIFVAYIGVAKYASIGSDESERRIRSGMLSFAAFFILGSVLLMPYPGISTMTAKEIEASLFSSGLFKGMTMHSQCLGPMIASLNVILLADLLFSVRRYDVLYLILLVCCPILMYKTSSRTGMGSYLASTMLVLFYFVRSNVVSQKWRRRVTSAVCSIVVVLIIAAALTPGFVNGLKSFIVKGDVEKVEFSTTNILATREVMFNKTLENFREKPVFGNGFQVAEYMVGVKRESLKSILTAPIEKGFWITAVLEEGGVLGLAILSLFFIITFFTLIKHRAYIAANCLVVVVLTNMGEFSMFSMSYTGGIVWSQVFAGLVFDIHRIRKQQRVNPITIGRSYYGTFGGI